MIQNAFDTYLAKDQNGESILLSAENGHNEYFTAYVREKILVSMEAYFTKVSSQDQLKKVRQIKMSLNMAQQTEDYDMQIDHTDQHLNSTLIKHPL